MPPITLPRVFRLLAGTILLTAGCAPESGQEAKPAKQEKAIATAPRAQPSKTLATPARTSTPVPVDQPLLTVEGAGLRWFLQPSGSARPVPFGRTKSDVLAPLEAIRGRAAKGTNQDCGAGPVDYAQWSDGLSIVFQKDRFVGWGLDRRAAGAIATAAGIGPGSTRAALGAAYDMTVTQSTLGTEFSAGELHGIFTGPLDKATVTDMWAGVSCVAR